MATFSPNKSDSIDLLTHQVVTNPTTVKGDPVDCRFKRAAVIFLYHGYIQATTDTNPGSFLVQIRPEAGNGTVNESWITVFEGVAKGGTPAEQVLANSESAASTVLEVTDTAGFSAGDLVYIRDSGADADGEWARIRKVTTNTSIQLIDGLANAKDTSDLIYNNASLFVVSLDLNAIESFRVIWTHEGSGAHGHIKALASTYDSDEST